MSEHKIGKVCGKCGNYKRVSETSGDCYHGPPAMQPSFGACRPRVGWHDKACSFFESDGSEATPEEVKATAMEVGKAAVEAGLAKTVGAAAVSVPKGKRGK